MSTSRVRVDDEEVEPAVLVVVEPAERRRPSSPSCRRHPEAESPLAEVEPDLAGDVDEGRAAERAARRSGRRTSRARDLPPSGRSGTSRRSAGAPRFAGSARDRVGPRAQRVFGRTSTRRTFPGGWRRRWAGPGTRLDAASAPSGRRRSGRQWSAAAGARIWAHSDASHAPLAAAAAPSRSLRRKASDSRRRSRDDVPRDGLRGRVGDRGDALPSRDDDLRKRASGRRGFLASPVAPGSRLRTRARRTRARRRALRRLRRVVAVRRTAAARACASRAAPTSSTSPLRRADDRQRREDGDLRRELGRLRRDQERREEPDSDRVGAASRVARGRRLRVGDHEEEKDEDLGRGDEQPPELRALDRPDVPGGRHRVPARGEDADPRGEREPEADGDLQEVQPAEDEEPADDDQDERHDERGGERAPPERERVGTLRRRAGGSRGRGRSSTG